MPKLLVALLILTVCTPAFSISVSAHAQSQGDAGDPAQAAIQLAEYEGLGEVGKLLDSLHLDARTTIPTAAIFGWYQNAYLPTGPESITVTGVRYLDWTWEVNGVTYPNAAEVSFTQPFADGETRPDVVRLVEYGGSWHWFFGRDRDFVNAQIELFAPESARLTENRNTIVNGRAPWGVSDRLSLVSTEDFLARVRSRVGRNTLDSRGPSRDVFAGGGTYYQVVYHLPAESVIPSAIVRVIELDEGMIEMRVIEHLAHPENAPALYQPTILLFGDDPENGVRFLLIDEYQNDAVGRVPIFYWATPGSGRIFGVSALDFIDLAALVEQTVSAFD